MKRYLLFMVLIILCFTSHGQYKMNGSNLLYEEEVIGNTYADLQSNGACQNRIYLFEDGTIGGTWTLGLDQPGFYDRGTGYNYFDGNSWNAWPTERIEDDRTGWPSYAPWGENGEIVVAHYSGADVDGLVFSKRENKGSGEWELTNFFGPPGHEGLIWPRMVTGGENNERIYLISLTRPIANGGTPYLNQDGAIVYSMSTDGGESWEMENVILPGMDWTSCKGYHGDAYAFAEPKDEVVAFVVGSYRHDLFLMKSTDQGETFTKTVIWDHPWEFVGDTITATEFYCPDGSMHAAIDNSGKVHVVFAISRVFYDVINYQYFTADSVDGIVYWNEDMETFNQNRNSLNPNNHPESQLEIDYNLIGYMQDLDSNGQINLQNFELGKYQTKGRSTMPQLTIDDQNRMFLIYSSPAETFDNGLQIYRRLWMRASLNGGISWRPFYHFAVDDPTSIFYEYSYPSIAANSDEYIYLLFQRDYEPGLSIYGGGKYYEECFVTVAKISKDEIVNVSYVQEQPSTFTLSQNHPNPFRASTNIRFYLEEPIDVEFEIYDLSGKLVDQRKIENPAKGWNNIQLIGKDFEPGVYFYTISTENQSQTKKMIVK